MNASDWIGLYAALVASTVALVQLYQFVEGRRRIHFQVSYSHLFSGVPSTTQRTDIVGIHVGNRGPVPLYLSTIGFELTEGGGLVFNQVAELMISQQLPTKLDPSQGFLLGVLPAKLLETLKSPEGVERIKTVWCTDGSSRSYSRSLTQREREQVKKALIDAENAAI